MVGPSIADSELAAFNKGELLHAQRVLGAQCARDGDVAGVRFAVWAPHAVDASVVGDFNAWDGRRDAMRLRGESGVWELFVPEAAAGTRYKFELHTREGALLVKADPYARAFEARRGNAAFVVAPSSYAWTDHAWLAGRARWDWLHEPFNCYEVHLGSWRRAPDGGFLSYGELAQELIEYVHAMHFTHVELLPITEHPLDESWGYQTTGYFAPTSRYGTPDEFRAFVDRLHAADIGVILDWVPGHFPRDEWALARFDGTALYEYDDPVMGLHPQWGTSIFNYAQPQVRSFLFSSALSWLEEFHLDGLRVDAVSSLLYLDFAREPGQWRPNRHGGRENLEAVDFIKDLNGNAHGRDIGILTIAEEASAWPNVTAPTDAGGLGFSLKWNMGWVNDTLRYVELEPAARGAQHNDLTFSQMYAYTENFVLPLSHDEVVHEKRSLFAKMPGDMAHKLAGVRLLVTYQMTHPGKKLTFMGNEFAHEREWDVMRPLAWELLETPAHRGVAACSRDLNRLYEELPALHRYDHDRRGFQWIDFRDTDASIVSFVRRADDAFVVVVLNFSPQPRHGYRIGAPHGGAYREIFNSDSALYGGSDVGNAGMVHAENTPWLSWPHSLSLHLPALGGLILTPDA